MIIGLILGADFATNERTAILAPIIAFIVLAAYKRQILRWTPLAIIVLIPVIHFADPGALGTLGGRVLPTSSAGGASNYSNGRSLDYPAVAPDILNNLIIGRGYGTMNTQNWRFYRILDNQYLGTLFEVGVVGPARVSGDRGLWDDDCAPRDKKGRSPSAPGARRLGRHRVLRAAQRDLRRCRISPGRVFVPVRRRSGGGRGQQESSATTGSRSRHARGERIGAVRHGARVVLSCRPRLRRVVRVLTCPLCLQVAPDLTARRTRGASRNGRARRRLRTRTDRQNVRLAPALRTPVTSDPVRRGASQSRTPACRRVKVPLLATRTRPPRPGSWTSPSNRKFHGNRFVSSGMVLQRQRERASGCRP